jgi:hypothetical protein
MALFKPPAAQNLQLKGARGFIGADALARPGIFAIDHIVAVVGYSSLNAGEETEVPGFSADLPANADVKAIRARLYVADETSQPEPEKTSVSIQRQGEKEAKFDIKADTPTRPRNVEIRLGKGNAFWNFAGTLVKDYYDLPDFAEQVNAYLDKAQSQDNQIRLKFLVRSDTPGRIKIEITDKSATRLQTQTWKNPLDGTVRVDRNLQIDFGQREEIPLDAIVQGAGEAASFTSIKMDVGGTMGPERMLGTAETHNRREFATISADYTVAQNFKLKDPIECVGISALLETDAQTDIYIEVQNDFNGAPASEAPLSKSNISLLPAEKGQDQRWTYTAFEAPVSLRADAPYWIVFKAARGTARLALEAGTETYLQGIAVNRGGQLWKGFGSADQSAPTGLIRLVFLPAADNQSAAVQIGINGTHWQPFDPAPEAKTLSFDLLGAGVRQAGIVIKSQARGALTLANVIQEY